MRVLVVDDNPDTLDLFSTLLHLWGHEVRLIGDSLQALPAALEFLPDIAFLDLSMPILDGWKLAERMRQHRVLAKTFLVAVTGHGRDEDRARSHAAGIDVHLLKPVDVAHLQLLLKRKPQPAPRSWKSEAGQKPLL